jgi:hypothetical protein
MSDPDKKIKIGKFMGAGLVVGGDAAIHAASVALLADRLAGVSEQARKLLMRITELAYHGRGDDRQKDTAYLPELHESCGLDVESMYATLAILQQAGLIQVEKQYPFEDVRLPKASGASAPVLATISQFCEQEQIPLREVIVDLRFDLLE